MSYSNYEEENIENKFEDLPFDQLEDKLSKDFEEEHNKPLFETNTNATIKSLDLQRALHHKTDRQGKEYYDIIMKVTCTIDGTDTVTEDHYGGLREYPNNFWCSTKSAFGKLKILAQDEYGITNYRELFRVLPGKKVKIRTITNSYQGQEYKKNVIQTFR